MRTIREKRKTDTQSLRERFRFSNGLRRDRSLVLRGEVRT